MDEKNKPRFELITPNDASMWIGDEDIGVVWKSSYNGEIMIYFKRWLDDEQTMFFVKESKIVLGVNTNATQHEATDESTTEAF